MIVKLAWFKPKKALTLAERIGSGIKNHMGHYAGELPIGVALTGGIAAADAGTSALFAKPGDRKRAALEGLGKGAVYGAILSGVEPFIHHGLAKKFKLPIA